MTQSGSRKSVTTAESADRSTMNHCMQGLGASELSMIRKLAGNDAELRTKTIRKLRKWLRTIAGRLPDSSIEECRSIIEPNFIRVWKALFYCMWMADKPLPQEQLAEQLSGLVSIFNTKPVAMLLFIEWFFRTMAREWPWIDRLRMDKFMMLIRRFLRSSFTQLHGQFKFKNAILNPFQDIISCHLFNRFPGSGASKKTRSQLKVPDPSPCPLGFQIHFTDIFMEELAKVCGEELQSKKLMKILSPFINELAFNDDERLTAEIKEKVFHYLMRQSDIAIDWQEGLMGGEDDQEDDDADEDQSDLDEEDEGLDEMVMDNGKAKKMPLDPRGGAVNVILPQLDVDYADLIDVLTAAGGAKNVRMQNRKMLYGLAKGFRDLIGGDYPLAVPKDNSSAAEKRAIKKGVVKQAAVKLIQLEDDLVAVGKTSKASKKTKALKKDKKVLKKQKKVTSQKLDESQSSGGGETSAYINDSELFDHVNDNYMSYLEEMHQADSTSGEEGKKNKRKLRKSSGPAELVVVGLSPPSLTNGTKKNLKKRKSLGNEEPSAVDVETAIAPTKRSKRNSSAFENFTEIEIIEETSTPITLRGKKQRKSMENNNNGSPKKSLNAQPVPVQSTSSSPPSTPVRTNSPSKIKLGGSFLLADGTNGQITPVNKHILTPTVSSGMKKRVSFVMARNLEHPHADYQQSIQRSPAIPFDAERQPEFGLLKSPAAKLANSPLIYRAKASDYF